MLNAGEMLKFFTEMKEDEFIKPYIEPSSSLNSCVDDFIKENGITDSNYLEICNYLQKINKFVKKMPVCVGQSIMDKMYEDFSAYSLIYYKKFIDPQTVWLYKKYPKLEVEKKKGNIGRDEITFTIILVNIIVYHIHILCTQSGN